MAQLNRDRDAVLAVYPKAVGMHSASGWYWVVMHWQGPPLCGAKHNPEEAWAAAAEYVRCMIR